jgi:hypothetical protein
LLPIFQRRSGSWFIASSRARLGSRPLCLVLQNITNKFATTRNSTSVVDPDPHGYDSFGCPGSVLGISGSRSMEIHQNF